MRRTDCFVQALAWMLVIILCGTANAQLGMRSPTSKEILKAAQEAITRQDWPVAMDNILALLRMKPTDRTALTMLRTVGPQFFDGQETKIDTAFKNRDSEKGSVECELVRKTQRDLETLNLKPKKKDEPYPAAPPELLELCENHVRTQAQIFYTDGLNFKGAGDYRRAAVQFRKATEIFPGFEDSQLQYEECKAKATKTLAFLLGPSQQATYKSYESLLNQKCLEALRAQANAADGLEFVELWSEDDFRRAAAAAGVSCPANGTSESWGTAAAAVGSVELLAVVQVVNAEIVGPTQTTEQKQWEGMVVELEFQNGSLIPKPVQRHASAIATFTRDNLSVKIQAKLEIVDVATTSSLKSVEALGDASGVARSVIVQGNPQAAKNITDVKELLKQPEILPDPGVLTAEALNQVSAKINSEVTAYCDAL